MDNKKKVTILLTELHSAIIDWSFDIQYKRDKEESYKKVKLLESKILEYVKD